MMIGFMLSFLPGYKPPGWLVGRLGDGGGLGVAVDEVGLNAGALLGSGVCDGHLKRSLAGVNDHAAQLLPAVPAVVFFDDASGFCGGFNDGLVVGLNLDPSPSGAQCVGEGSGGLLAGLAIQAPSLMHQGGQVVLLHGDNPFRFRLFPLNWLYITTQVSESQQVYMLNNY